MNGADVLIGTLIANDVTACFANPGTSEMQFVAALDRRQEMRPVLCQFEGVATGAADGFGRMAERPACTLLHLGPGYGNGVANLHNARRAFTPIVNVIGDHATYHRVHDAPLNSDLETLVQPNSLWVGTAERADDVGTLTAQAIEASYGPPGGPVSLILPADAAWTSSQAQPGTARPPRRPEANASAIDSVARAIRAAKRPVLLIGGDACRAEALVQASRLQAAGLGIFTDTFLARLPRGAGIFAPGRLPYYAEQALAALDGVDLMVLVSTAAPVAFFAYPDRPNLLTPDGCTVATLANRSEDAASALRHLAEALDAPAAGGTQALDLPEAAPTGALTPHAVGLSMARHMPEGSVVCDDSVTSGAGVAAATAGARPHDVLGLTGGAIGIGLPLAIGAAVATPGRRTISLNGDGAAMYTVQSLWTMAREALDITVVIFANRSYRVLRAEMERTGSGEPGPSARKLLDLSDPVVDWTAVSRGLGVRAVRCATAEDFDAAFARSVSESGPTLIEAVI